MIFVSCVQYLDNENPNQPIYLYINCPGGSVIAGLAIYDTIQHIKSEVVTVNLGLAASMASFLLCAGSRGPPLQSSPYHHHHYYYHYYYNYCYCYYYYYYCYYYY